VETYGKKFRIKRGGSGGSFHGINIPCNFPARRDAIRPDKIKTG
jgi:hypothetical protein